MEPITQRHPFDTVGYTGRFVVMHHVQLSTYAAILATPRNAEYQNGKIWGFPPLECDRINRSRLNLAHKCRR